MLYRRFVWPTLAGFVLSLGRPLAADTAQLAVDPSMRFQTIEGFGSAIGSHDASPTSNVNFGSPRYTQFAHDFSQDLGASMVRVEVKDALKALDDADSAVKDAERELTKLLRGIGYETN